VIPEIFLFCFVKYLWTLSKGIEQVFTLNDLLTEGMANIPRAGHYMKLSISSAYW